MIGNVGVVDCQTGYISQIPFWNSAFYIHLMLLSQIPEKEIHAGLRGL